ncbi:MAG: radical SAM protein [Geobacter sp.]|nr:radical SAM protein [Geobacter sp.]
MKNKLLLVLANSRWHNKRPWLSIPYAALILSALLKDTFTFQIVDANARNLTEAECQREINDFDPDIVMVSALSVEYHRQFHTVMSLVKAVNPSIITVIGGVYPTTLPEEVLKDTNVDFIFIGHAEERIVSFLQAVLSPAKTDLERIPAIGYRLADGTLHITPVASYISSVAEMVRPDYSLLDIEPYLVRNTSDYQVSSQVRSASLLTTYGCPFDCVFCATRTISGKGVAFRPVNDVLDEIDYLVHNHAIEDIVFLDDYLLADKQRITSLLQGLIDRNYNLTWKAANVSAWHLKEDLLDLMKQSGCTQITISVESGSQRVLRDIIRKPLNLEIVPPVVQMCRTRGIDIAANFVIGFPGETWDDLRMTFKFAETCDFDLVHFHIATPLPATDLYRIAQEQKLLPEDFSFFNPNYFGFGQAFIATDEFTTQELLVLRAFEWDRINFSTSEKTAKVAALYNMTLEELTNHRKMTRLKFGIHLHE